MTKLTSTLGLLIVLSSALQASARMFAGCWTQGPTTRTAETFEAFNADSCGSYCGRNFPGSYKFSYYREPTGACFCADLPISTSFYAGNPDQCGGAFDVRSVQSNVKFYGCSNTATFTSTTTIDADVYGCPYNCASGSRVGGSFQLSEFPQSVGGTCTCGSLQSVGTLVTCARGTSFLFTTDTYGFSGSSALARRQLKERLEQGRSGDIVAVCPAGLTACQVPHGGEGAFECIDPSSELESCGGCVYGNYGTNGTAIGAPNGINCDLLDDKNGGMTCQKGKCVAVGY